MPKVTVIMPSLNVAKYIKPCIESVLAQTLQDIEILLIDAGSVDGTLEIMEKYAKKDGRIKIIHSDKKSYGYQLNMGIAMATGEYVSIVETDDMIVPKMLEKLYAEAIRANADYVKGTEQLFIEITPHLCFKYPIWSVFPQNTMERMVVLPKYMPELFIKDVFLWTGIYRRDFIGQITLNESPGAAYQDAGFMLQSYMKAERAVYVDDLCYLYRQDNMGASTYDRRAFSYFVKEYDYMERFLHGMAARWYEVYYQRMLMHCLKRFQIMGMSGEFWEEALPDMENMQHRLRYAWEHGILREPNLSSDFLERLLLFLDSPRTIYEAYASQYRPAADHIHAMLKQTAGNDVIIFGCGKRGRFLHMLMEYKSPGTVRAYCDNQETLRGCDVQGIHVVSPKEANCQYPGAVYLIAGRRYEAEMQSQLRELGVCEDRMFTYTEKEEEWLFYV